MQFLAVIFAGYTLYSPITKKEPTAHGELNGKRSGIFLDGIRRNKTLSKRKGPDANGGSKRTGPRRRNS